MLALTNQSPKNNNNLQIICQSKYYVNEANESGFKNVLAMLLFEPEYASWDPEKQKLS